MKRFVLILSIIALMLSSCSGGDICRVCRVGDKEFENITDVTVDEGDTALFYSKERLTDLSVAAMVWNYDNECYDTDRVAAQGIELEAGSALAVTFDFESEMPYVCIRFTDKNGAAGERYLFCDDNDKLWVLQQY